MPARRSSRLASKDEEGNKTSNTKRPNSQPANKQSPSCPAAAQKRRASTSSVPEIAPVNSHVALNMKRDDLNCCVCRDLSETQIFQCSNGHLLCKECHSRLIDVPPTASIKSICPICRVQLSKDNPIRNQIAEGIVLKIPEVCKNAGCKEVTPFGKLLGHMKNECLYRITECKFKVLGCIWSGTIHACGHHEAQCEYQNLNGKRLLSHIQDCDRRKRAKLDLQSKVINVLSSPTVCLKTIHFERMEGVTRFKSVSSISVRGMEFRFYLNQKSETQLTLQLDLIYPTAFGNSRTISMAAFPTSEGSNPTNSLFPTGFFEVTVSSNSNSIQCTFAALEKSLITRFFSEKYLTIKFAMLDKSKRGSLGADAMTFGEESYNDYYSSDSEFDSDVFY
jgi:hypothetical protein